MLMYGFIPYKIVELEKNSFHMLVEGELLDTPINLIVDSGASRTVVNKDLIKGIEPEPVESGTPIAVGFMADQIAVDLVKIPRLRLSKHLFYNVESIVTNLSSINAMYEKMVGIPIDGLIGCDFLLKYVSSIDIKKGRLYLLKSYK